MKYKAVILMAMLFFSGLSNAIEVSGKVGKYRTFSEVQSVEAARHHVVFDLSTDLSSKCRWLYLSPNDTTSISLLLAAKMSGMSVTVDYSEDSSPWHEETCKVTEVRVN